MKRAGTIYPDFLTDLPEADITFRGVSGTILQGKNEQALFIEIDAIGDVPPHTHGAQWGVVLEGEMILTIAGETKKYAKGDCYYIPGGAVHSATFNTKVFLIDVFADKERYVPKK